MHPLLCNSKCVDDFISSEFLYPSFPQESSSIESEIGFLSKLATKASEISSNFKLYGNEKRPIFNVSEKRSKIINFLRSVYCSLNNVLSLVNQYCSNFHEREQREEELTKSIEHFAIHTGSDGFSYFCNLIHVSNENDVQTEASLKTLNHFHFSTTRLQSFQESEELGFVSVLKEVGIYLTALICTLETIVASAKEECEDYTDTSKSEATVPSISAKQFIYEFYDIINIISIELCSILEAHSKNMIELHCFD